MERRTASYKKSNSIAPLLLLVCGYGLYLVRFGYGYGVSDQDDVIPYLLHLIDPGLFENDWFVQTQLASFSVRTCFVYALRLFTLAFPLQVAFLVVYLACWSSIALAIYYLADLLTHNRTTALISTAVACLMTPFWTMGGNDVMHSILVPSMAAWAIGLWAFVFYLRDETTLAAVSAGLATLLQALVGLQIITLVGGLLCIELAGSEDRKKQGRLLLQAGCLYLLTAGAALGPLIYQQFSSNAGLDASSLFFIMALFRNPHHYLFYSFDKLKLVQFLFLLLLGYLALLKIHANDPTIRADFFNRLIGLVTAFCLIAFLYTEINPSLSVAKLQLFKMTVVIKILMVITVSHFVIGSLPSRWFDVLDRFTFERPVAAPALLAACLLIVIAFQPDRLREKIYPFSRQHNPEMQVAAWALANSDEDEVFSVPPSWSAFRSHARRAIVINHKSFPYRDADVPIWYARLTDVTAYDSRERTDATLLRELDRRYNTRPPNDLELLSHKYGFDYVIRNSKLPESSAFSLVREIQGWYVYKLSSQRLASR